MSPEVEIERSDETQEKERGIDIEELRKEIRKEVAEEQEKSDKVRVDESTETEGFKEKEISDPQKGDLAKLSTLELFVIKFILDNRIKVNSSDPSKDDAITAITFSIFGKDDFENNRNIVLKTFNSLYGMGLITSAYLFEVSPYGRSSYQNYDFDSIYDKIKSDAQNKIKQNEEWLESIVLIKKSRSSHLFNILNKELTKYGISYLFENQIHLMDFFVNKDIEERLEYSEKLIKEKITNSLNSIMDTGNKIYLLKLFAHKIIACDNTYKKYTQGQKELSEIVVEHPELFSKLYIFSIDTVITDIFDVCNILKQMISEEKVISTVYGDPEKSIKKLKYPYNKWNKFFNEFKEEMIDDFKDIILTSSDGYVHIPKFCKDKVKDLFFRENECYLKLLTYLSQTRAFEYSHKEFCDLLVTEKDICRIPQDADKFLEKYYPVYYDKIITKGQGYDDIRIQYEPIVKEFIKDNLTTEDIKAYYHLQMMDELGEIQEDKDTVISRYFNKESIKKLDSIHFFSPDERYHYLTALASSNTISRVINDIYSGDMFKEELLPEINQRFTTLTEQEKALLVLIIVPESLDSGIKIKLKDTDRLFSTQVLATDIGGQRFDVLKKEFYILKTKEGFKSSIKPYVKNIFDSVDLDNLPYKLFKRSKEETERYIDKIFKNKSPSYFYRILKGELNESEVIELEKCGLILSDGNNNPIVHKALKDVLKEKWREHWNKLDIISENIIKEAEDKDKKTYAIKCSIETFKCFANPYMNIVQIGNDWISIEIVDKDLTIQNLRLTSINFEKTVLLLEKLVLNQLNPEEKSGKQALMKGLTAIELETGRIYSANPFRTEIAQTIENHTGIAIRVPNEYFSILHELAERVKEINAEKLHEKAKKARTGETQEKDKEIERIDELWLKIFFDDDDIILFDPDHYLNGKLKTFTYLVHGLPGCGKTTLIERQAKKLKDKIEEKSNNWKTGIHYLSIKRILDRRASPIDFCHSLFSEILRDFKPSKDEKGRPGIIIIQDLDAIAERKMAPTSDVKEGQKIGIILKDFLKEIFEKQAYQLAIFAEATNLNNLPEYLLQFFPNRKVVLAPDTKGRTELFDRVRSDKIKERLEGENPEIVKELIDIIGLPITQKEVDLLSKHTQGFTYRDLVVIIRDLKQNIKEKRDKKELVKLIDKYEPSLPQYLRIEVPDVDWADVKGLKEQKQKVKEALLIIDEDSGKENLNVHPAKGLLFYGIPGTGKTFLAKAIATKSKAYFIHLTPPQIFSKYFGESEQNLKHIFTLAKELSSYGDSNVIIFIDELDGFAPSREKMASRPERSVLSVLLSELDGLEELKKVTIIGTTNKPEDVDAALIRSGRFDELIECKPPNYDTCVEIFYSSLKESIGEKVPEFNDIKNALKEVEKKTYRPGSNENNLDALFVPADFNSFADKIARKCLTRKDEPIIDLIKGNLNSLIEEKEKRINFQRKSLRPE